jgi:hypothetical protein
MLAAILIALAVLSFAEALDHHSDGFLTRRLFRSS